MEVFKTTTGHEQRPMIITKENYERATENDPRFVKLNKTGGFSRYAYCPVCQNPIQIVGLLSQSGRKPYGRHTGVTVSGIANWNQQKYEYCPYAVKNDRREIDDGERPPLDETMISTYNLLRDNFDVINKFSRKPTGSPVG